MRTKEGQFLILLVYKNTRNILLIFPTLSLALYRLAAFLMGVWVKSYVISISCFQYFTVVLIRCTRYQHQVSFFTETGIMKKLYLLYVAPLLLQNNFQTIWSFSAVMFGYSTTICYPTSSIQLLLLFS